ncbi:hypothetical protein FPZ24_03720 [Sphingomonas panacisoli]|uniref:YdhG-like domain-containing protein n=1 Tax=Sphingomonas panacisoli TaxID=1813879 RepID=A0A5B8LGB2_9SPHN|nr:YdeI/OmpD-associated family protein [Sphingomonas panacisoli]QDZ06694.1 hypothetical protein FPZ24_03720 [Sphingomonas panacisoli]
MSKDPRVDAYIEKKADFARPILTHLRDLIHGHAPAVEETIKWSMPFFTYKGELLANMAAFKAHAAFGFWSRGDLATGKEGEAMGQYGRIADVATMPPDKVLLAALDKALAMIDAGTKPKRAEKRPKPEAEVPAALAEALAVDPEASAKWDAFPPGCRREYCEWIADAKRDETRAKRVAQTVAQTREGKRMNWKYENC